MRDFWDRDLYVLNSPPSAQALTDNEDPSQPTKTLGLAEFANGNFIGDRHTYAELIATNGPLAPFWYPFPSLYGGTDYSALTNDPAHNGKRTSYAQMVGYRYIVAKTNQGVQLQHHAAVTALVALNGFYHTPSVFTDATVNDPDVLQDYHDILIPKAVKYSAGLIDYYFRGTLGVGFTNAGPGVVGMQITNTSTLDFSGGEFRLFYDDASGNRSEVTGGSFVSGYTNALASGGTVDTAFTFNTNAVQYVLMYQGTIGTTNGTACDPVDASLAIAATSFTASAAAPSTPILEALTFGCTFQTYDDTGDAVSDPYGAFITASAAGPLPADYVPPYGGLNYFLTGSLGETNVNFFPPNSYQNYWQCQNGANFEIDTGPGFAQLQSGTYSGVIYVYGFSGSGQTVHLYIQDVITGTRYEVTPTAFTNPVPESSYELYNVGVVFSSMTVMSNSDNFYPIIKVGDMPTTNGLQLGSVTWSLDWGGPW